MFSNVKKREKSNNFQPAIYSNSPTPPTPSTPINRNKRFSRRPESSNTSLQKSRASCSSRGLPTDRDNSPKTPNNNNQSNKKILPNKNGMLTLIKNTAYIKTHQRQTNHSISQLNPIYCDSTQKLQNGQLPVLTQQARQFPIYVNTKHINHNSYSLNNSTNKLNKSYKLNNSINSNKMSKYYAQQQQQIALSQQSQSQQTNITSHNNRQLFHTSNNINNINYNYNNKTMMTFQSKKSASLSSIVDLQFQFELKNKQLMILQDQNTRLKKQLNMKKQYIIKLEEQIKICNEDTKKYKKQIVDGFKQVKQILKKYTYHQQQKLSLKTKLPQLIKNNINQLIGDINSKRQYQEVLVRQIQEKLSMNKNIVCDLEMKASFYEKFKEQCKEWRCANKRLGDQIERIKKRNQYMQQENTTLRASNSKMRKSITQLKNISRQKQKHLKNRKVSTLISTNVSKQYEMQFSFQKQVFKNYSIIPTMLNNTNINNNNNNKINKINNNVLPNNTKNIKNNKNIDEIDAIIIDSQNQNNLSFNISNLSTEQLMEMQDLI